jgi:hypothetical protein
MPRARFSARTQRPFTEIVWLARLLSVTLGSAAYPETLKAPDSYSTRRIDRALATPFTWARRSRRSPA